MRTPLLLVALALTACGAPNVTAPSSGTVSAEQPANPDDVQMLALVNEARAQGRRCGTQSMAPAQPLAWNSRLAEAARAHAADMAERNYFSHVSPEGEDVRGRAGAAGYTGWLALGENLQGGATTPAGALEAWLGSPPHCHALMDPGFRELGAAGVNRPGSPYGTYWVQVFGAR